MIHQDGNVNAPALTPIIMDTLVLFVIETGSGTQQQPCAIVQILQDGTELIVSLSVTKDMNKSENPASVQLIPMNPAVNACHIPTVLLELFGTIY